MKVEKVTSATGQWGLRAFPEDYDGTPRLPVVQFDRQPRVLSPDRVALASYLFFAPWISGRLETPQWHSPALAQAIVEHSRPAFVQTQPVELYAKALPLDQGIVDVDLEGTAFRGTEAKSGHAPRRFLRLMRSDRSAGARTSFGSLELSTNAWLFALGKTQWRQLEVLVACAALFAEDLQAGDVRVAATSDVKDAGSLRALCSAVRLGLRIDPPSDCL